MFEAQFFFRQLVKNLCAVDAEFLIELAVLIDDRFGYLRQAALGNAKLHRKADCAANQAAEDVALVDIARRNAALIT